MNIMIANSQEFNPEIGGVEKVSCVLAGEFKKRGHNICFTAGRRSVYGNEYTPAAEQLISMDADEVEKFICDRKIDIILNQAGNDSEYSDFITTLAKKNNVSIITEIHTDPMYIYQTYRHYKSGVWIKDQIKKIVLPIRDRKNTKILRKMYQDILERSDRVVLLSETFRKTFLNLTGAQYSKKVDVISNPSIYLPEKPAEKKKQMLFLGRIDHGKNVRMIIDAWKLALDLARRADAAETMKWNLMIMGDGPQKESIQEYVSKKNIDKVEFVGYGNPEQAYRESAVICMASWYEGLPMVLIEGMSNGCIPVSTDSFSSVTDVIENGKNGYIVRSGQVYQYAEALFHLIIDEKIREKMAVNAVQKAQEFLPEKIVDKWIGLFNEVLGNGK